MPGSTKPLWAILARWQRTFPILQIVAALVVFTVGVYTILDFGQSLSVRTILVLAAITGFAAAGQTLMAIIGGLDLSIAGIISASAIALAHLTGVNGWPLLPAVLVIFVAAGSLGAITGWICHRYRMNSLVLTLGTGSIALGAVVVWIGGDVSGSTPQVLSDWTSVNGTTFGIAIPPILVLWILLGIALGVFLRFTVRGRQLFATGANPFAAHLALIPTRSVWVSTFAASAVFSAIAGILLAGFSGADKAVGDPYFFTALTAVIVGGTTFGGARGDYNHTIAGALLLSVLGSALAGWGLDTDDRQIIFGLLILFVVALYGREGSVRNRV